MPEYFYRYFFIVFSIAWSTIGLHAQEKQDWQQSVHYQIEVALDDINHSLDGYATIQYTNNSPEDLKYLYIHLWPNAYKTLETAYAEEQLESKDLDYYYSLRSQRGSIDKLDFKVGGELVRWTVDETNIDIAKINLAKPLKAGESLQLETPFFVQIPELYSRLGHIEQSYYISQWFPKVAVFDEDGWHPMPYLSNGEFYANFGTYEVGITVPNNYTVAATGVLDNKAEEERIRLLTEQSAQAVVDSLESERIFKTLHFRGENIHDFAWYADKQFNVKKDQVFIGDREVSVYLYHRDTLANVQKMLDYAKSALSYYSDRVGEYPYSQYSLVVGSVKAGMGMEYPMLSVIQDLGNENVLEETIVHEVGHCWFQGVLASNEREHPWLDEGINTYYTFRYMREQKADFDLSFYYKMRKSASRYLKISDYNRHDNQELAYQYLARKGEDQSVNLPATKYSDFNYGALVYSKTAMNFEYLEAYIGKREMDRIMSMYYTRYGFKHPKPEDLAEVFEQESRKYIDWFFDDLIMTNKRVDYKIDKVYPDVENIGEDRFDVVKIENEEDHVPGPFSISAIRNDSIVKTVWYDGFVGTEEVWFPRTEYDQLIIDALHQIPEYDRSNNSYSLKGFFKKVEPFRFKFLGGIEDPYRTQLNFSPVIGYNHYDRLMLGMAFYNSLFPKRNFEYALMPMYSLGSKSLVGAGELAYHIYPKPDLLQRVTFQLSGSSYAHGVETKQQNVFDADSVRTRETISEEPYPFYKVAPEVRLKFKERNKRGHKSFEIGLRHVSIIKKDFVRDTSLIHFISGGPVEKSYYVNELDVVFQDQRALGPYKLQLKLQQHKYFLKASVEGKIKYFYKQKKKGFSFRLYAGHFLWNNLANSGENLNYRLPFRFSVSGTQGSNDYLIDEIYLGRLESTEHWTGRQIYKDAGGIRTPLGLSGLTDGVQIGFTNNWIISFGTEIDFPPGWPFTFDIPLTFYFNVVATKESVALKGGYTGRAMVEFGASISLWKDRLEVFVPIFVSADLKKASSLENKFADRITFLINFNQLNPVKAIRNIQL